MVLAQWIPSGGVHRLPVDIGPVEAADIDHLEVAAFGAELGVATTDGDVVEEDVGVRVPAPVSTASLPRGVMKANGRETVDVAAATFMTGYPNR